ncbi:hypothetical protein [Chryseobacterium sp. c4a]|uniref:hypothetical protein n=1 Tax=Chryseobacterium sp. c4a TaxID=1573582 RepID=UPI00135B55F3|nr:hypothetical protein [Chryseobacterium sp. c4a]
MKYLFIIPIILILFACNPSNNNSQALQSQLDSLNLKLDNSYRPGFGEFMSNIQVHHNKLWFAGINQNWKLADFEIGEIQENIEGIKDYCRNRPETKSLPMINPALDNLRKAIEQQSSKAFKEEYINLTNTCNTCHQVTKHEFNVIIIPSTPPYSNQDFKLHNEN